MHKTPFFSPFCFICFFLSPFILIGIIGCGEQALKEAEGEWVKHFTWNSQTGSLLPVNDSTEKNSMLLKPIDQSFRVFLGNDTMTLNLFRFSKDYFAYQEFSELAKASNESNFCFQNEYFRKGNTVYFTQGSFLGKLELASHDFIPETYVQENLKKISNFPSKPKIFDSFLFQNRVLNSERIYSENYLGKKIDKPIFSAQYNCHQDTAIAFRLLKNSGIHFLELIKGWHGQVDTLEHEQLVFEGLTDLNIPILVYGSTKGIVGLEGCSDLEIGRPFLQKMQEMTILVENE